MEVAIIAGVFGLLTALIGRGRLGRNPVESLMTLLQSELATLAAVPPDLPHRAELERAVAVRVALTAHELGYEGSRRRVVLATAVNGSRMATGIAAFLYGLFLLPTWSPLAHMDSRNQVFGLALVVAVFAFIGAALIWGGVLNAQKLSDDLVVGQGWELFRQLEDDLGPDEPPSVP